MSRVSRVYLVRHGQVFGYENFPIYGHTNVDLTEVGIIQAERLAEKLRLASISAIYSSDLKRCVATAQIIARYHDVPFHVMPELREMYFGDWEGLSLSEVRQRFPDALDQRKVNLVNYEIPGHAESLAHLSERVTACFNHILHQQKGNDLLLVGHGGVNRVILCEALSLDLAHVFRIQQDYGCLNIIDYHPESTVVRLMNG